MRDWLAGQALAGLLANAPFTNDLGRKAGPGGIVSGTAAIAYAYADAMLSERKRAA